MTVVPLRSAAVPAWQAIEEAEPEFAARVRRLLDAGRHKTIATLRADGSPRISGIECEFADGDLRFGSMTGARKGADLERDPRFALHGPTFHPEHYLCAFDRGRLVATTRDIPMQQWFGGRPVGAAGIAAVATVPEARGTGVGDRLMRELLRQARDRGAAVTSLFPATVPFYRRLGYEYGGLWTTYRARLSDLPRGQGATTIELFEGVS